MRSLDDIAMEDSPNADAEAPLLNPHSSLQNPNQASDHWNFTFPSEGSKSGMISAFMNMANSIIGAGIIGQPYAFRQAGIVSGIVLLIALTLVVDWTIRLIVVNTKLSGTSTFQGTLEHCYGRWGLVTISVAQFVFAFGGMIAFCIIVGDTIPTFLTAAFPEPDRSKLATTFALFTDRRFIIALLIFGVSYPLSLYRDISKLSKASGLALVSMLIIIVTIVTQAIRMPKDIANEVNTILWINGGIFQAIGVIAFAFVCHHNSLLIYGSLEKPTLDRFKQVTHYSTGISMIACLIVAFAGVWTFGAKTQGNVLNNFPISNTMVNVARLCFGLNMLTTLPLECFVCREVINHLWMPDKPLGPQAHFLITTALVSIPVCVSLFISDLGVVFELIGSTSACALAFILPPLCYLKLKTQASHSLIAIACIGFGILVMILNLGQAIVKLIGKDFHGSIG